MCTIHVTWVDPLGLMGCTITAGKNFKDHFIRHKGLLKSITGKNYRKFKEDGEEFLNDLSRLVNDGRDWPTRGSGPSREGQPAMEIYRGEGVTLVTREGGEFVTLLESGAGMDLGIQMLPSD